MSENVSLDSLLRSGGDTVLSYMEEKLGTRARVFLCEAECVLVSVDSREAFSSALMGIIRAAFCLPRMKVQPHDQTVPHTYGMVGLKGIQPKMTAGEMKRLRPNLLLFSSPSLSSSLWNSSSSSFTPPSSAAPESLKAAPPAPANYSLNAITTTTESQVAVPAIQMSNIAIGSSAVSAAVSSPNDAAAVVSGVNNDTMTRGASQGTDTAAIITFIMFPK